MSDIITEAQSLLHSLEASAGDIGPYINAFKPSSLATIKQAQSRLSMARP